MAAPHGNPGAGPEVRRKRKRSAVTSWARTLGAVLALAAAQRQCRAEADDLVRFTCSALATLDVDQGRCACIPNSGPKTSANGTTTGCECDPGNYFWEANSTCVRCPAAHFKRSAGNEASLCVTCPELAAASANATTCVCPGEDGLVFDPDAIVCTCARELKIEPILAATRLPYLYDLDAGPPESKALVLSDLFRLSLVSGKASDVALAVTFANLDARENFTMTTALFDAVELPVSTQNASWAIVLHSGCSLIDDATVLLQVVPIGFRVNAQAHERYISVDWSLESTGGANSWPAVQVYLEPSAGVLYEIGASLEGALSWAIPATGLGMGETSADSSAGPLSYSIWLSLGSSLDAAPVEWSLASTSRSVSVITHLKYTIISAWDACDCSLAIPVQRRSVECQVLANASAVSYTSTSEAYCARAGLVAPESERLCFTCPRAQDATWVVASAWSDCSATSCGSQGTRTREAHCIGPQGEEVDDPASVCGPLDEVVEKACNLTCEPIITRSVLDADMPQCAAERCTDRLTGRALQHSECGDLLSADSEECQSWTLCNQTCGGGTTFGTLGAQRVCNAQRCDPQVVVYDQENGAICVKADFYSTSCDGEVSACDSYCEAAAAAAAEDEGIETSEGRRRRRLALSYVDVSLVTVELERRCPDSDIVTPSGSCCPRGSVLDKDGACCSSGMVDACGVCSGSGLFVDLTGHCCREVDAAGFCCGEGTDALGVCAGVSTSANATATCGNGICETGEACDGINLACCPEDCPFAIDYCSPEMGLGWETPRPCGALGKCLLAQGVCDCFGAAGRASQSPFETCVGPASCTSGHTWTTKGCVRDEILTLMLCTNGRWDEGEHGLDCGGYCPFVCSGTLSPTMLETSAPTEVAVIAGQIPFRVWVPVIGALGGLTLCTTVVFCVVHAQSERLRRKLAKIKRKVDPDLSSSSKGPSPSQRDSLASKHITWVGRKSVTVPDEIAQIALGDSARRESVKLASMDARLQELERREALLRKEIAMEGWVENVSHARWENHAGDGVKDDESEYDNVDKDAETRTTTPVARADPRATPSKKAKKTKKRRAKAKQANKASSKRAKGAVYGVLKPVGELLIYKDMVASGFGNIHMNFVETMNLRSMTHAGADGKRFWLEERPRTDLPPIRSLAFQATTAVEAEAWADTLRCLIAMYMDQRRGSRSQSLECDTSDALVQEDDRDDEDAETHQAGLDEAGVSILVREVRSESSVNVSLAAPRTPAPSAPIPPDLPAKSPARSVRFRSRTVSRSKRGPRARSASVPPPLPPWPGNAVVDAMQKKPRRTMSTGDLRPPKPRPRTVSEARAAGASEYEINNDIWSQFQQSLTS